VRSTPASASRPTNPASTRTGATSLQHTHAPARPRSWWPLGLAAGFFVTTLSAASVVSTSTYFNTSLFWWLRQEPEPMSDAELGVALTTVGLSAAALTAVGADEASIKTLVSEARLHLSAEIALWRSASDNVGKAQGEVDRLTALIQAGTATPEDLAALKPAQEAALQARSTRDSMRSAFFDAATAALPAAELKRLQLKAMSTQREAGWDLPTEYLLGQHKGGQGGQGGGEPEWLELRDALSHVRIAEKLNQQPEAAATQTILEAKADPDVAAASAWLSANLAPLTDAWNKAVYLNK
jgi:hypothetical protein